MSSIVSCSDPSPIAVTPLCSMFVSFLFISSKIVCIFSVVLADVLVAVMGLIVEVFPVVRVGAEGAVGWTCSSVVF